MGLFIFSEIIYLRGFTLLYKLWVTQGEIEEETVKEILI